MVKDIESEITFRLALVLAAVVICVGLICYTHYECSKIEANPTFTVDSKHPLI